MSTVSVLPLAEHWDRPPSRKLVAASKMRPQGTDMDAAGALSATF
jgi:hypothetical protein